MALKSYVPGPNQISINFDVIVKDLYINGCLQNIAEMLPQLYDHQHEDVLRAEKRFEEGKGYLFTNGTGTGKTFVGLGIAKRFYENNKKDILIVVPTEQKSIDWIEDGELIGLKIIRLDGIEDAGHNVTVTTYANFYQNDAINRRIFDLIIYDESHYLNQNAAGNQTVYLSKHKKTARLPSALEVESYFFAGSSPTKEDDNYYEKKKQWEENRIEIKRDLVNQTKVLFLSATPFAYHKSIKYADGCIFNISERIEPIDYSSSYNQATGFDKFLQENFGYHMRTNRISRPESEINVNLLNEGMKLFYNQGFTKKYKNFAHIASRKYNYNFVNQLLETMKAQEVYHRIQEHLDLNRKIVIFHSYNNSVIPHPFRFDLDKLALADDQWRLHLAKQELILFNEEYSHLVDLDLSDLKNTRRAIRDKFPAAVEFNGTVGKKKRSKNIKDFNDDNSGVDIIIVQEKAGKEGISLHDRTGKMQRVSMNLGLPTAPTTAIQLEGRTYRSGLLSDAIYEYITVHTDFEKIAFATKIAERSKTVENLAMGNLARDLETSFKEGYINAHNDKPFIGQGKGGKEIDRKIQNVSDFEKSKTYYWSRAKKTSQTKSSEGLDYFATPEPLGYCIVVKWLNPIAGKRGLEPSAGHGAIARWFPENTTNTFIEPSYKLISDLNINASGQSLNIEFEEHYIGNKYEFIAMNPPFGKSGKTAMEHIRKACGHLYWKGGKLIAIVPQGAAMQKRLDAFYIDPDGPFVKDSMVLTGEILLPSVLFERAGTKTMCKVIKIEIETADNKFSYVNFDLTHCEKINDFFDEIEHLIF